MRGRLNLWAIVALLMSSMLTGCGFKMVEPGHVGLKIDRYGSHRGNNGVQVVQPGAVWYNPMTERIAVYPVSMQNVVWTKDAHEGTDHDQSMTLSSKEGTSINCDVGVNLTFNPDLVAHLYVKFRQDPDVLIGGYVRTQVRNHLMARTTQARVMDIIGSKQDSICIAAMADLNRSLGPDGFMFDMVTFTSKPRTDESVEKAINSAIAATQRAIQEENKVRQVQAQAEQRRVMAGGIADSTTIVATAQAEANDKLRASLTPEIIAWNNSKKWNGVLPTVVGAGAIPMVSIK